VSVEVDKNIERILKALGRGWITCRGWKI